MEDHSKRTSPRDPQSLIFQGAILSWPNLVHDDDGNLFRPLFPLWVNLETGQIYTPPRGLLHPDEDPLPDFLEALRAFLDPVLDSRPRRIQIEVCQPELADYLHRHLPAGGDSQRDLDVRLLEHLPELDEVYAHLTASLESQPDTLPGLLEARGVTLDRVRAFAEAAAEFYRAAPWRHLTDSDLVEVESPKPPRGMACFVVLGAGGTAYGLGIYASREAYNNFLNVAYESQPDAAAAGLSQVIFDRIEDLPEADATLWVDHNLPVAADEAYPLVVKYRKKGKPTRPTKSELTYLEAILRAVAATSEAQIDSGRWDVEVRTVDGPRRVSLCLPDLLEPPAPQDWIERGFAPDRRGNERLMADIGRYLDETPGDEEEKLRSVDQIFTGRSLDDPLTQPRNLVEQAQELCYQAFEARGRRRIQLARRALELDPDCADAHLVLAEQAGVTSDALAHFQRAIEAARRTLGPECFTEDVGHFWGYLPTRPYMRALQGTAETLRALGRLDEAIELYQEMLRLNPNDNQGARDMLLPLLMATGRDGDAARLLKAYENDPTAVWAYGRAILAFRLSGRSVAATRELRTALRANRHVPELLVAEVPHPQPPHYQLGSFDEACIAVDVLHPAVEATPGLLDWIDGEMARLAHEADKLRRDKRRKERAKQKKRKKR